MTTLSREERNTWTMMVCPRLHVENYECENDVQCLRLSLYLKKITANVFGRYVLVLPVTRNPHPNMERRGSEAAYSMQSWIRHYSGIVCKDLQKLVEPAQFAPQDVVVIHGT